MSVPHVAFVPLPRCPSCHQRAFNLPKWCQRMTTNYAVHSRSSRHISILHLRMIDPISQKSKTRDGHDPRGRSWVSEPSISSPDFSAHFSHSCFQKNQRASKQDSENYLGDLQQISQIWMCPNQRMCEFFIILIQLVHVFVPSDSDFVIHFLQADDLCYITK